MKTALLKLIETIEIYQYSSYDELERQMASFYKNCALDFLEDEKNQIIEAYCDGFKTGSEGDRIQSEEYYNKNYNK